MARPKKQSNAPEPEEVASDRGLGPDPEPGTYHVSLRLTRGTGPEAPELWRGTLQVVTAHGRPQANALATLMASREHPELYRQAGVYIQVLETTLVTEEVFLAG